jgi:hypothetical protein
MWGGIFEGQDFFYLLNGGLRLFWQRFVIFHSNIYFFLNKGPKISNSSSIGRFYCFYYIFIVLDIYADDGA